MNMSSTCNAPQWVQGWAEDYTFASKSHEWQRCPLELHDQAIQDIEYVKQTVAGHPTETNMHITQARTQVLIHATHYVFSIIKQVAISRFQL